MTRSLSPVRQLDCLFMLTLNIWTLKAAIPEAHGKAVLAFTGFNA